MCKQNKQRNKAIARKIAKTAKSNRHHAAEGEAKTNVPSQQGKPSWVQSTGKKGWWNSVKKGSKHKEKEAA